MTLPNFVILGPAKTGTTSIYRYFQQHPQIFMSPAKEPNFFAFEGEKPDFRGPDDLKAPTVTDIESYQQLFRNVTDEIAIGEASVLYLSVPKAAERIAHYLPEAKLITILRDPVERAYSNFLHLVREGREPLDNFGQAIQAEEERIRQKWKPFWYYKQQGFYYAHLQRYLQYFDRQQIGVWFFDDLQKHSQSMLQEMFQFLGVDDTFVPDISEQVRVAPKIPKNKTLHKLFSQPNWLKDTLKPLFPKQFRQKVSQQVKKRNLERPKPTAQERGQLIAEYREDILQLQDFLQRDLSHWLQ